MRRIRTTVAAILLSFIATAAHATERHEVNLPAGRLGEAVIALGRQAAVSIGISDPALANRRVRAVRGRMSAEQALAQLLREVPARSVPVGRRGFRIVAARLRPPAPPPSRRLAPVPAVAATTEEAEETVEAPPIVVTGTRRNVRLADYPGTADVISASDPVLATGLPGSEALLARLPTVSSTHLGPGRNKLFLRGLADSSFNGPTQATTGQYLGETRINYNAPDPDLRLYDIERIEVLSGPQGTLYGAGSLGGIIRILPNRPQLDSISGQIGVGVSATQHGAPGADLSATINLPLINDRLGLRLAGYGVRDGGYIDDTLRGKEDVNQVETAGLRAGLRLAVDSGWTIDLGATYQGTRGRDGQFADRDAPPLTRRSPVGQPFSSDYLLADLVVAKDWKNARLVSAFGYVQQSLTEQFDATLEDTAPRLFRQDSRIKLLTAETRLSGGSATEFSWVVGGSFISNELEQRRRIGSPDALVAMPGVANGIVEISMFGEAGVRPLPGLSLTVGGRLTHSRLSGGGLEQVLLVREPVAGPSASRNETVFLPSIAVSWEAGRRLVLFARYQESFRPGGLAVADEVIRQFRNDDVASFEAGFRWSPSDSLALSASGAYTLWSDIQADTIGTNGFPTTSNIGDGTILSTDIRLSWRPVPALSFDAGLVVNQSEVTEPQPAFMLRTGSQLPNVADLNLRLGADYRIDLPGGDMLRLSGNVRQTGSSTLGVGEVLGIEQGNWVDVGLGIRWEHGAHIFSLNAFNLFDEAGNRFAFGSPFTLFLNPQVTPMRPRTLRLGYQIRF